MTISTDRLMDFVLGLATNGKVWVVHEDTGLVKEYTVDEYVDLKADDQLENTLVKGSEVQAELESLRILRRLTECS
jgi:hypothetical protein